MSRSATQTPPTPSDGRGPHDSAVWSANGERVQNGKRAAPLWFAGRCWSTVALADDVIVTRIADAKDKLRLRRWRRYMPA